MLNLQFFVFLAFTQLTLSLHIMATTVDGGSDPVPGAQGSAPADPSADSDQFQYSMLLEHLIGDKRQIKDLNPTVMGGLPTPFKSDEEKMIQRGMESCAFKAVLACVGGKNNLTRWLANTTIRRLLPKGMSESCFLQIASQSNVCHVSSTVLCLARVCPGICERPEGGGGVVDVPTLDLDCLHIPPF